MDQNRRIAVKKSEGQLFQIFMKSLCGSHLGTDSYPLSLCGDIMTFIMNPEINLGKGIHVLCEFFKNAKTAIFF